MDNIAKHWIFGNSLHKEIDSLHFLYRSLVNNIKEHREWTIRDVPTHPHGVKSSVLLISSPSDLTPGFDGTVLFANDRDSFPQTDARVVRLCSFFPDEINYSKDIPLLPLRPDKSILDAIPSVQEAKSVLLLREPSENERNRNIFNALKSLPRSASILLDAKKETEIFEALGKCRSASLVLSSVESPLCNQLFAEVVRMNKGKFLLFAQDSHSPFRFSGNHDQVFASGGRDLSLRSKISSILKHLDKDEGENTEVVTSLPSGIDIIEEIEEAITKNVVHYFAVTNECFDSILSHPIEFQFSRDIENNHASYTLHYLKYLKNLPKSEETLRESVSLNHFFQKIGNALLTGESDNLKIYGVVDLVRNLPFFINHMKDYLIRCSLGPDLKAGIRLIELFRSSYVHYSFPKETEMLFDEFFTHAIEWLRKAKDSEATVCLGRILSLREDQQALIHIFNSIIKTDKNFARDFLSRSLSYGVYAKRGAEMPPGRNIQTPKWMQDYNTLIEQLEEVEQTSNYLNYLLLKGDIWKSEKSRIKSILEDADKLGGLYDIYLLELLEDSILLGLSDTSGLLANKLLEKSKRMNSSKLLHFHSLLALQNANCQTPEIDFLEMNEKIPICKTTFPDQTSCALSIIAKLAKDEKLSKFYRDFSLKMGFRKAKRLDTLLKVAQEVESSKICKWAVKIMNNAVPRS